MPHDDHDHHGHNHAPPEDIVVRVKALENLMDKRGFLDRDGIDLIVDTYENKVGPRIGARMVAKAWTDPAYKALVLSDANEAAKAVQLSAIQGDLIVVENTVDLHNVVVCTLCSCYPWNVLGLPPAWYKAMPYRARVVREPRKVLEEFGLTVPDTKEVRVWDSNSELRYMVLPQRPEGTEGMSEEALADLVTRDSMIGVQTANAPS